MRTHYVIFAVLLATVFAGIRVPRTIIGTFKAASHDGEFIYEGAFEKTETESGHWEIYGESYRHQDEAYASFSEALVYDAGKQHTTIKTSQDQEISRCIDSDDIPQLELLKHSFEHAKEISQDEIKLDIECDEEETMYTFEYLGLEYLACVDYEDQIYTFHGRDFTAELSGLSGGTEMGMRKKLEAKKCKRTTYEPQPVDPDAMRKRWYTGGFDVPVAAQKPCFFIHGAGVVPKAVGASANLTGFPSKEYWGDIKKFTKQCSKHEFGAFDTTSRGWDSTALQKEVCDFITAKMSSNVIEDAIIFTHSMGGMTIAAAIANGVCRMSSTASWYQSQSPFTGSIAATYVDEGCKDPLSAVRIVAAATGDYCDGDKAYPVYKTLRPNAPGIGQLAASAKTHLSGAQCGDDSWGLNTIYSPALALIASLAGFKEQNDGMVAFPTSCQIGFSFSTSASSKFYKSKTNHVDGTCRSGDGWWGSDRQPCSWFSDLM